MAAVNLESNLAELKARIARSCRKCGRSPEEITLIAVTKTVDIGAIELAHKLGIRHFGENRVQEAEPKIHLLSHIQPPPVWHMIGHLQSNKIKTALGLFNIIQSVDSLNKAILLDRRTPKKLPVFLEVNVAGEKTKGGFSREEAAGALAAISHLPNLEVRGLMTIAPPAAEAEQVRCIFRQLREMRDAFGLKDLSMGMSDDFEVAIEEGATLIRVGRALFGERS